MLFFIKAMDKIFPKKGKRLGEKKVREGGK